MLRTCSDSSNTPWGDMGSAAFLIVVSHLVKLLHTAIILFNETEYKGDRERYYVSSKKQEKPSRGRVSLNNIRVVTMVFIYS